MPNATVRANARTLPEAANCRSVLSAVLAAGALAAAPSMAATTLGPEPELKALIVAWNAAHRRLEQTYEASCAASDRVRCPIPQALVAAESDARFWSEHIPGRRYQAADVTRFRALKKLSVQFDEIFSCTGYDDRIAEIIASWDIWQQEQAAANEREGVPQAEAVLELSRRRISRNRWSCREAAGED